MTVAKYTVELKTIVNSNYNIFDFNYEFYDDSKKEDFQQKFINHFLFREIGTETVGRFQHYLKCKFDETLPYYNMLFRTALIDYEKTINYNLTESFTRENNKVDSLTGNVKLNGYNAITGTTNNTLNRTTDNVLTGEKTSNLDSTTTHNEDTTFTKNQSLVEDSTITKNSEKTADLRNVQSDTPNSLLSIGSIKANVYASKADLQDNLETIIDSENNNSTRTDINSETTEINSSDIVDGSTKETSTDTVDETLEETNNGSITNDTTFENATNSTQDATGTENEEYTKVMKGSFGVITEADMLQKHINLQKTLSKIMIDFFNECDDLFMQIY
jgi:hypothetical protein